MKSLEKGELFVLKENNTWCACVVLNSDYNMGYVDVPWNIKCEADEVLIPHALAVSPDCQGKGIGKRVVKEIWTGTNACRCFSVSGYGITVDDDATEIRNGGFGSTTAK